MLRNLSDLVFFLTQLGKSMLYHIDSPVYSGLLLPTSAAIALGPHRDHPLTPTMKNIITSETEQNLVVFYFFRGTNVPTLYK